MSTADAAELTRTRGLVDVGDGLKLFVEQIGPQDGSPVIFLHGSGPGASGWSNFRANAVRLAAEGYRCILPDALGYGDSDKPVDRPYTLDLLAACTRGMADSLGVADRPVALVGNSMGGALAILLTLEHPAWVERLVLMAPGGLEERETYMEMRGIRRMLRCIYGPEGITEDGIRRVFELQVHALEVSDAVLRERYEASLRQPIHVFKTLAVPDLSDRLAEISCPVLCLWGVEDLFCPVSGAMKVARAVADSEVVLLSGCGHWVMVERPELFHARCAAFLSR